jgi:hypothetical protein
MSKFVVVNGDTVTFEASFGAATIVPVPTTISGTGMKLKSGAIACVAGDEAAVVVAGVAYTTASHSVPGVGSLQIKSLGSDQTAQKLSVGGKKAILVGSKFDATFTVMTPAQMPPPASTPDPVASYSGKGQFVTSDAKLKSA